MKRSSWFAELRASLLESALRPSSPGARKLLTDAERTAEEGLHVARGLFWAFGTALFCFFFGLGRSLPWFAISIGLAWIVAVWVWVWRLIRRGPRPWVKYALILLDGWVILRAAITVVLRPSLVPWLGGFGLSAADVLAATPPLLVYLALTGALRINPRAALFSTATALVVLVYVSASMGLARREAVGVTSVIAFAGAIGVGVAWALRRVALRARQGEVLERYVPETLMRALARTGDPERGVREEEVTLLMADVRGFTAMTEHLPPSEAVSLVNDYLAAVVAPLVAEGAIIDDYAGDGLLAHFEGEERAQRALRAVEGMRSALERLNSGRPSRKPIRIGIAIHAGPVLIGTRGASGRLEYAVTGDAVNVTSRLEECNKQLDSIVVVSLQALAGMPAPLTLGLAGPRDIALRGHERPIAVFYLPRVGPPHTGPRSAVLG